MTGRRFDPRANKERDLQLDMELQGTFPASDPLTISRFPPPKRHSHLRTTRLTSPRQSQDKKRDVRLKRAYEPPAPDDGTRILVDRLWPRGVKKTNAAIDEWMKEIAPSTDLRKWFGHAPKRWPEFRRRYRSELQHHTTELKHLRELAQRGPITLVYSAHDEAHNDAVVLRGLILRGD